MRVFALSAVRHHIRVRLLGGEADDAAGEAGARVAGGLGGLALGANLGGVALAEVILELVDDARAADDGVGAGEGDLRVLDGELAPVGGGLDVTEVAGVALLHPGGAVLLAEGVEVGAGGHAPVGGVAARRKERGGEKSVGGVRSAPVVDGACAFAFARKTRETGRENRLLVPELVDVETVEALGEAGDVADDGGGAVTGLGEGDGALDAGGAGQDADGLLLVSDDGEDGRTAGGDTAGRAGREGDAGERNRGGDG